MRNLHITTAVCLIPGHDPILLAKTVVGLKWFWCGRLVSGIGSRWDAEKIENPLQNAFNAMGGLSRP
jgi:alkanesulfonate monooxygenase SsuD/methylene tetrahydromethanopterin reductase-like flavin-dependent oxidoreductase (luciferase family)